MAKTESGEPTGKDVSTYMVTGNAGDIVFHEGDTSAETIGSIDRSPLACRSRVNVTPLSGTWVARTITTNVAPPDGPTRIIVLATRQGNGADLVPA